MRDPAPTYRAARVVWSLRTVGEIVAGAEGVAGTFSLEHRCWISSRSSKRKVSYSRNVVMLVKLSGLKRGVVVELNIFK